MTTPADTPDVLTRAAAVIRVNGLHKTAYWPRTDPWARVPPWKPGTPCCAVGAIAVALNPEDPDSGLEMKDPYALHLGDYLEASGIRPDALVTRWNDAPERTKEEVIEVLLDAAKWEGDSNGSGDA